MQQINGTISEIFDINIVSSQFRVREFVIENKKNPEHSELIKFELTQDCCDFINDISIGDTVTVYFTIKGRKYMCRDGIERYFNSLRAWTVVNNLKNTKSDG